MVVQPPRDDEVIGHVLIEETDMTDELDDTQGHSHKPGHQPAHKPGHQPATDGDDVQGHSHSHLAKEDDDVQGHWYQSF